MKYVQPIGAAVNAPYIDANPGLAIEGSPVPAAAIEHPMREIEAVITGAGLVAATGDLTQLRQAIAKMIQSGQRAVIINNAVFAGAVTGTGKAVYWDSGNSRFDLALADGTAKQNCVGFADVANANVYAFGDAVLFAGLTPGSRYYLDGATAGAITVTAPANAVFVGIARNATELFVDVDAVGGMTQAQADARYLLATKSFGLQGAFRDLTGSATGLSALATYAADELTLGDETGNFQTLRTWSGSITMTTLGVNGLDVGAVAASTWYHAYAIAKPDGSKAFIASLSSTGPSFTNAAGYTKWVRIGAFRTDGTANKFPLAFVQYGRSVAWKVVAASNMPNLPILGSGAAGSTTVPTWVGIGISAVVPPTASMIDVAANTQTNTGDVIVAPNAAYGAITSTTNPPPLGSRGSSSGGWGMFSRKMILESTSIYWASSGAAGLIFALGWEDSL